MDTYLLFCQLLLGYITGPALAVPGTVTEEKQPASYPQFKAQVAHIRDSLSAMQLPADSLQKLARQTFTTLLTDSMYGYWKGTTWNFYGTTETPRTGGIACGYFVTTVLRDLGVKLNRIKLAETYSQKMIETLVQAKYIRKFGNKNYAGFMQYLQGQPDGVYIVGLDYHTGFLQVEQGDVQFLHSGFWEPRCVIKQPALNSIYFTQNTYFVTGCLTCDEQFMQRWLTR